MVKSLLVRRRRGGRVRPFVFSSWVVVVVLADKEKAAESRGVTLQSKTFHWAAAP